MIIDGGDELAYLKPKPFPLQLYNHNRLGAVFVPNSPEKDVDLVAHVAENSPAQHAGIRNGDILLRIDGMVVIRQEYLEGRRAYVSISHNYVPEFNRLILDYSGEIASGGEILFRFVDRRDLRDYAAVHRN